MQKLVRTIAIASLLALSFGSAAHADTVLDGSTDGGAFFRIVVPDAWNGDLVIYNHGFSLSPIGPVTDLGPLAGLQLSEGYAVAATSYQQIGWALFKTKNDLQNMVNVFKANFGTPDEVILHGASLGGIVTAQALENANLGNVVAAYPICGAVAGSRSWDGAIDLRLLYDAICEDVPGAFIPGGPTGLPAPGFPLYPFSVTDMALAAQACFGILAPAPFRTLAQVARLDQYLAVTTLPENFVLTDLGFGLFGMSDLIFNESKLNGKQGIGNANVTYSDPQLNADVERVSAQPGAANRLGKNFTPKGNVGNAKIVSIHTDGDGLVIVENESQWQKVVDADNLTVAIVDEAGNTHCGFSAVELVAGWESLRGWIASGVQPTATDIQNTCLYISGGDFASCRIDPSYVIGEFDDRVSPR
jgi:hypothetical protein